MSTSIFRRQTLKRVAESIAQKNNTYSLLAAIASELEWIGIRNEIVDGVGVLGYIWGGDKGKSTMFYTFLGGEFMPERVSTAVSAAAYFHETRAKLAGEVVLFFRLPDAQNADDKRVEVRLEDLRVTPQGLCAQQFDSALKTGEFGVTNAAVMPGSFKFAVELTGKGGHGSAPSGAVNPIDAFAALSGKIFELEQKYKDVNIKINAANAGTVCNIIPETLKFTGSAAYFLKTSEINALTEELLSVSKILADNYECKLNFTILEEPTLPFFNNELCALVAQSAMEPLGTFIKNGKKCGQSFIPPRFFKKPFLLLQTGAENGEADIAALEYAYNGVIKYLHGFLNYQGNIINGKAGM